MKKSFSDWIGKALVGFLELDKYNFNHVNIKKQVIDDIIFMADHAYPKEFAALLGGKIEKKTIQIDSILLQEYQSSMNAAAMKFAMPMLSGVVGSVHSHPGFQNFPSKADIHFFDKTGIVHFIICRPYKEDSIAAYDMKGEKISYSSVD